MILIKYNTKLPANTMMKIREASFAPVYLTTPLYVLEITNEINLTKRTTEYAIGKLSNSFCGIDLKLKRKKKASVNEKAQIARSINKIVQRGKLYFQK